MYPVMQHLCRIKGVAMNNVNVGGNAPLNAMMILVLPNNNKTSI